MKNIFSNFTKRERFIFTFTIAFIACVFAYFFVLEPARKTWSGRRDEVEAANLKLFKNLRLLANKESLEREYDNYKDYFKTEGDKEQELAAVLKEIEAFASACGVKITSIKPKGEKRSKNYKQCSIELISEANIEQFAKFIYDLEGSKKLLKVERLVLSLKGSQSDLLKGTLVIRKISF
jgi:Tfp pilus assembly protein PilO